MEHLQEVVQEGIGLIEEVFASDLQLILFKINEERVRMEVNNALAEYVMERVKERPYFKKLTRDNTKGGSD